MLRINELKLPLHHDDTALRQAACEALGIHDRALRQIHVVRRGYDARRRDRIHFIYTLDVEVDDESSLLARQRGIKTSPDMRYRSVAQAPVDLNARPVIVGFGPCGLFAALLLAQMGFRPIVIERGGPVRQRTRDTWGLWRKRTLNPESNVQFGEGGAGTFSDGKLYSRIKDPAFRGRKVLEEFATSVNPTSVRSNWYR
jgi:uncharacterized FAD-dependent dehydrogenase